MAELLIVDDDLLFSEAAGQLARDRGMHVRHAGSLALGRRALDQQGVELLVLDLDLPDGSGIDLLERLQPSQARRVVVITGHPSMESAIRAVSSPIAGYLVKPLCMTHWESLLDEVAANHPGDGSSTNACEAPTLLGESAAMSKVRRLIERVAPTTMSVMIRGESGTGKELAAQAVHRASKRCGPMIALNCGAVSPELLGSQLFGHERGSFTGASQRHLGVIEQAANGTLFLDEITEMPPALQTYLLRALETGTVTRLGGSQPISVPLRVIAATNRDPARAIADGRLREDLYYRLADITVTMPPLRSRPEDLLEISDAFLAHLNAQQRCQRRFSEESRRRMHAYPWPGNVRELRSVVTRAFFLAENDKLEVDIDAPSETPFSGGEPGSVTFRPGMTLASLEELALRCTLASCDQDKRAAAKQLGISVRTIQNHLARWQARA